MAGVWVLVIAAVILLAAAVMEIRRELHTFQITHYTLSPAKLAGLNRDVRILFMSDLHNAVYGRNNDRLFRAVQEEEPDLILIGGDMLVGKKSVSYEPAAQFVEKLPAICPVYYANGNHEQRMKEEPQNYMYSYEKYRERLKEKGVTFLENENQHLVLHGKKFMISGLELPLFTYGKLKKPAVDSSDIEDCLCVPPAHAGDGGGEYRILMAHNPSYAKAYREWGADVILSGHLHGGVVRLPGIGGVVTPQFFLFPRYSGEMTVEGKQAVIVSRGLGTHTINIRLFNMPEVISLCLKKPL